MQGNNQGKTQGKNQGKNQRKKKLITSALPYVNNVPHLGNIIGSTLSADVYARFCRSAGYETLYVCATDEYGTATETKAMQEGLSPQQICQHYHHIHRKIYRTFNIQFDYFGRTSTKTHTEITQSFFKKLYAKGKFIEQETEQLFCTKDQLFLADRYVKGTCPHCKTEKANGDQCENCGKLLQPTELINPECSFCQQKPVLKKTKHLYLDLPQFNTALADFEQASLQRGRWSKNAIAQTKSWHTSGLQPRPITRDLKWGVRVPLEGYADKVFYVWFDAVLGYISVTKEGFAEEWQNWWQDPENTDLVQFMGKDNIPFHTVIFPAILLGTGERWTKLTHISSTEFLNYENQKFSKSGGVGVFGDSIEETQIPIDLWRFYLLHNRPERADTNFSWAMLQEEVNSLFIDNIGNLLNRVLRLYHQNFDAELKIVPLPESCQQFLKQTQTAEQEVLQLLEDLQLKDALKHILLIAKSGNQFFQSQEPWRLVKKAPAQGRATLNCLLFVLRDLAVLLEPYMPSTAERMLKILQLPPATYQNLGEWDALTQATVGEPQILYAKLADEQIKELQARYNQKDATEQFKKLCLKAGKVCAVAKHPQADKLYILSIDVGEDSHRTIVSGLVEHYTKQELLQKNVVIVANLEPAKIRGVLSAGMVLTAEGKDKSGVKKLELLSSTAKPGEQAYLKDQAPQEQAPDEHSTTISIAEFKTFELDVQQNAVMFCKKNIYIAQQTLQTEWIPEGLVS